MGSCSGCRAPCSSQGYPLLRGGQGGCSRDFTGQLACLHEQCGPGLSMLPGICSCLPANRHCCAVQARLQNAAGGRCSAHPRRSAHLGSSVPACFLTELDPCLPWTAWRPAPPRRSAAPSVAELLAGVQKCAALPASLCLGSGGHPGFVTCGPACGSPAGSQVALPPVSSTRTPQSPCAAGSLCPGCGGDAGSGRPAPAPGLPAGQGG